MKVEIKARTRQQRAARALWLRYLNPETACRNLADEARSPRIRDFWRSVMRAHFMRGDYKSDYLLPSDTPRAA